MKSYLLSGIGAVLTLLAVMFVTNAPTQAQLQPGTCIVELVTSGTSTKQTCENRTKFNAPAFTGVPCAAPADGIILYAKLQDGTCLPVAAIAAPGFQADNIRVWQDADENGVVHSASYYARLTPTQSLVVQVGKGKQ